MRLIRQKMALIVGLGVVFCGLVGCAIKPTLEVDSPESMGELDPPKDTYYGWAMYEQTPEDLRLQDELRGVLDQVLADTGLRNVKVSCKVYWKSISCDADLDTSTPEGLDKITRIVDGVVAELKRREDPIFRIKESITLGSSLIDDGGEPYKGSQSVRRELR